VLLAINLPPCNRERRQGRVGPACRPPCRAFAHAGFFILLKRSDTLPSIKRHDAGELPVAPHFEWTTAGSCDETA
jgi:hypothetical protein